MPVERCQRGGKAGYKWGASGFCHIGSGARERAARQGRAIEAAQRAREDAATTGRALAAMRRQLGVPSKVEATYRRRLVKRVERLHKQLTAALDAGLRRLGEGIDERAARTDAARTAVRADTAASELRGIVRAIKRRWNRSNAAGTDDVLDVGRAVERSATTSTVRAAERIGRVEIEVPGPRGTGDALAAWARQNVDLIKTIDRRHFDEVERAIVDALRQGRRTRDLRTEIAGRFGVSERRAQLIARDQLATLNTQITRARQEDLGIERFRWTTAGDDRVREEHEAIDGEVFTWADGHPTEGRPGEPVNCRCVALPVIR
jgi:SPP1 gp7 family putative phage head morphogenesis protein